MGQITNPSAPGITVLPIDRQTGPSAGPGNSGDLVLFLGANAGKNNAGSDVIALGNGALSGGNTIAEMIAIGVNASALSNGQRFGGERDIVIGHNANAAALDAGNMVIIGNDALRYNNSSGAGAQGYTSVIIGNDAARYFDIHQTGVGGVIASVMIGDTVCGAGAVGNGATVNSSVVIGASAIANITNGVNGNILDSTVIGANTLPAISGGKVQNCVLIGNNAGPNIVGTGLQGFNQSVGIGASVVSNTTADPQFAVAIGAASWLSTNTVCIGYEAGNQALTGNPPGTGSIYIGTRAGISAATPGNWVYLMESSDGVTTYSMMYGQMDSGNLALGNLPAANRDFTAIGCTNALKLTNGARGAGNPAGGGFFYVAAGALHWVGSAGTDTVVAPA
jgi:hypothetical protein